MKENTPDKESFILMQVCSKPSVCLKATSDSAFRQPESSHPCILRNSRSSQALLEVQQEHVAEQGMMGAGPFLVL